MSTDELSLCITSKDSSLLSNLKFTKSFVNPGMLRNNLWHKGPPLFKEYWNVHCIVQTPSILVWEELPAHPYNKWMIHSFFSFWDSVENGFWLAFCGLSSIFFSHDVSLNLVIHVSTIETHEQVAVVIVWLEQSNAHIIKNVL